MAKANHLWGNHEPDKRHMVDGVGVVTERDRKSYDRRLHRGRPRLAQHPGRCKAKGKGGFTL